MKIRRIGNTLIRAFVSVVVFTIVLLGALGFYSIRSNLVQNERSTTLQLVGQLNRVIENYVKYMDDIALMAANNEDVRTFMTRPSADSPGLRAAIGRAFETIRSVRKDIDSVILITADGRAIASAPGETLNPSVNIAERFREIENTVVPGRASVSSSHVENLVDDRYPWVISLVREMRGTADGPTVGLIQVDLNYEVIAGLCRNIHLGKSGYVFILNQNGDIVYHPRQQLIYGNLKTEHVENVMALGGGFRNDVLDNRAILYTSVVSQQTGWTVVAVSYLDELFASTQNAEYYFLMLSLLAFAAAIVLAGFLSTSISRPIESLRASMQAVESGNFDIDITVRASNEIFQLARDCDIAVKKVRDLLQQSRHEQELKRKLELRTLQAQINPHFLYNTLDSIIWMIELGENERAIGMTSALARFFRLGITRGSEEVGVRAEIEYVQTYLLIQKERYQDKLSYSVTVNPDVYDYQILKLLLQPLLENAIYHGIKNKDGPGLVEIMAERDGPTIVIRIRDNGVGMSDEQRSALNEGRVEASETNGVGVRNVQERIRLFYGEFADGRPDCRYGVQFESVRGVGTTAVLRIPAVLGSER